MKQTIVYDEKVPFVDLILGDRYDLCPLPACEITADTVADADGLIIRTRTIVDKNLLENSRCKVVATATIGIDHIDRYWCEANGITVANAPGCNAPAVAQWVFAAIAGIMHRIPSSPTLGIVGVGHVGSIVAKWGKSVGFNILACDPPRARAEKSSSFCTIDEIADKADIITFHTPLTTDGEDATFHLAGHRFLSSLKQKPYILNAARGPVVDTSALIDALDTDKIAGAMIDCWEGEPEISLPLLDRTAIATPHIAGYSLEGKIRASVMAAEVIDRILQPGYDSPIDMSRIATDADGRWIDVPAVIPSDVTLEMIAGSYDISADSARLKSDPAQFEKLRNNYSLRHEVKQ